MKYKKPYVHEIPLTSLNCTCIINISLNFKNFITISLFEISLHFLPPEFFGRIYTQNWPHS